MEKELGDMDERWRITQRLSYTVSRILGEPKREDFRLSFLLGTEARREDMLSADWPGKPKKLIVHGRAKSNFGIWAKMRKHHVFSHEICDQIALQVLVEDNNHAREIQKVLLDYSRAHPDIFTLAPSHDFEQKEERRKAGLDATFEPIRDYLEKEPHRYRAIRMNFKETATGKIFEIQITPIDVYSPPGSYVKQMVQKAGSITR